MREIKFRAWSSLKKTWHYFEIPVDMFKTVFSDGVEIIRPSGLDYEKWQQFTGLKDRNGREIYEGDIVRASIYVDDEPQILEVEYQDCCFVINYEDSDTDVVPIGWFAGSLEVIGNIYESPELLK